MKTFYYRFVFLVLLAWILPVYPPVCMAQTSDSLRLGDCVDLAVVNSFQLEADSFLFESLQMRIGQEEAGYNPQISGALGFSGLFLSPYTFGQHYIQALADWDMGKWWYKTGEIHEKVKEQQGALMDQNRLELAGLIAGLYLDVLHDQLEIGILHSRLKYLNQHLEILTLLWKAGTTNQLDILQTKSMLVSLRGQVLQRETDMAQSKYILARLMGLNSGLGFKLAPLKGVNQAISHDLEPLADRLMTHPLVLAAQKEYEAELLRKRELDASLLPHIQSLGGYSVDGDPTGDGNYFLLGLSVNIPIYQWKKNDYRRHEIDLAAEAIQSKKREIERNLSIQFGKLMIQIAQYEKMFDLQNEKISIAGEALQVADVNYRSGLATHLDFLDAQQHYAETLLQKNTLQNRYLKTVITLYLLGGKMDKIETL